jgi:hypothetical protein
MPVPELPPPPAALPVDVVVWVVVELVVWEAVDVVELDIGLPEWVDVVVGPGPPAPVAFSSNV